MLATPPPPPILPATSPSQILDCIGRLCRLALQCLILWASTEREDAKAACHSPLPPATSPSRILDCIGPLTPSTWPEGREIDRPFEQAVDGGCHPVSPPVPPPPPPAAREEPLAARPVPQALISATRLHASALRFLPLAGQGSLQTWLSKLRPEAGM
jgi:hypothetical protein